MKRIERFSCYAILCASVLLASCKKPAGPVGPDDKPNTEDIQVQLEAGKDWCGVVVDSEGNGIAGVVVSDGYNCTKTDSKGIYQLKKGSEYSAVINISVPAEYRIPAQNGSPRFWHVISSKQSRYDFTLEKLPAPENDFYLFGLADPQCQNNDRHISRFKEETIPDLKAYSAQFAAKAPVYGITLGDIGYNTGSTEHNRAKALLKNMRDAMAEPKSGMLVMQTIGNHDHDLISNSGYSEEKDIEMEKYFNLIFGPVNYSFNRGQAHIVSMDDIQATNPESYKAGFRDDQLEWLKQDLSYVDKDKLVILCVHIPLCDNSTKQNVAAVLNLLKEFSSAHILSGHTHKNTNTPSSCSSGIYEHTQAAVCGAWWWSTVNTDGSPNGYAVYEIKGNRIESWKYKGVDLDADKQIRMYRGYTAFMDDSSSKFYFPMTDSKDLWANIWNWDDKWTVDVYEDGVKTGSMTRHYDSKKSHDAWAVAYHIGIVGRGSNYDATNVKHLLHYELRNPDCKNVEIRAKDRFGNEYVQSTVTDGSRKYWPMAPGDNY